MIEILFTLIIYPLTQIIEAVFTFSQKVFKEPGISVMAVSAVLSLLSLPLYNAAEKWQKIERDTVKRLKPKVDRIYAVFRGNERFMLLQTLYRQNHYHPAFTLRNASALLLQVPFFIAAYFCLSSMEALKGASFFFIPNLGAQDGLLSFKTYSVNVLPVLMTIINVASAILYSKGFPLKDKIPLYGMALLFLVLLYHSPSGLVLYWTMNNVFSLAKNTYFKITLKNKKIITAVVCSLFLIFLMAYLMVFYHGNYFLRLLFSSICLGICAFIWARIILITLKRNIIENNFLSYLPRANFLFFAVSLAGLWILTGLYIPSTVIGSSPQEFSYIENYTSPLYFIANTVFQAAGIWVVWPILLYFLLKKQQRGFLFLGYALLFCALVNVFLFPGRYGLISLELVFDSDASHRLKDIAFNLVILILPLLALLLLCRLRREKILVITAIFCLFAFVGLSLQNIYKINRGFSEVREYRAAVPPPPAAVDRLEPFFNLSQTGMNTVVLMLDRAHSVFIPLIFDEEPELAEKFAGFVYYPNTVSYNGYTSLGAPPLFGGYEYTPLEINRRNTAPLVEKHNEALLLMPRIFSESGFTVTVTDPPYPNYSITDDLSIYDTYPSVKALITDSRYTDYWLKEHDINFPSVGEIIRRNLLWYSLFRIAPLVLRQGIYLQGDYCAPNLTKKMTITLNAYAVLDYLPRLTGITGEKENTALIMVNNTTHAPSFLQAPDYRPASVVTNFGPGPFKKETAYHVNISSIKRLAEWFDFLAANNVYDNTRIIIVSDHGAVPNFIVKTSLPFNVENFNPLLMVKDFNAKGPLVTDYAFMSNADVPFLALEGQIEKPINPFTGNEISTDMKLKPLYIAVSGSVHIGNRSSTQFTLDPKKDYYVHTNVYNENNWIKAEP